MHRCEFEFHMVSGTSKRTDLSGNEVGGLGWESNGLKEEDPKRLVHGEFDCMSSALRP